MGDMASLWAFEELGHKLLLTSLELERLKAEANEKSRKNDELIHLLKFAIAERDEAKDQLQKLLSNKAMPLTTIPEKGFTDIPHFLGSSPLAKQGNVNSSVTESKSLSEAHNCHSHEENLFLSKGSFCKLFSKQGRFFRRFSCRGRFLGGRIPIASAIEIPTTSIKGHDTEIFPQRPLENIGQFGSRSLNLKPYAQMSCGSSQVLLTPLLNFTNVASEINANSFVPLP